MNKITHSLHKECFNNPQNITISSLWSSGFANDSQEQDAWARMGTRRNPENKLFIPGALVIFICKWEWKKITWGGDKRKKWRIPEWEEELWNDSIVALPPVSSQETSCHPVGEWTACTVQPPCYPVERRKIGSCLLLSKLPLHIHGPTFSKSLRQSSAQNPPPHFIPSFLVCPAVASLIFLLSFPYPWCLSSSPIQYASKFSNPYLPPKWESIILWGWKLLNK